MSKKENNKEDLDFSHKKFENIVKISLIIGIIVVSGFIIYFILNPESGYVTFGLLNSKQKAENYPTNSSVDKDIDFYAMVGNYLGYDFTFHLKIKKGDNQTKLSKSGSENADLNFTTDNVILKNNEEWISDKLSISFSQIGTNQIIIVELWEITEDNQEKFNNILWLRLNITA